MNWLRFDELVDPAHHMLLSDLVRDIPLFLSNRANKMLSDSKQIQTQIDLLTDAASSRFDLNMFRSLPFEMQASIAALEYDIDFQENDHLKPLFVRIMSRFTANLTGYQNFYEV